MNDVDDFLDRHGYEIGVIVFTFGGKAPENSGVVKFIAASERTLREHRRLMTDEEFKKAIEDFGE